MSGNSKKARERAEASFSKSQTNVLARSRIVSEHDAESQARDAKTAKLRELRLEKEADERAAALALPVRQGKR